MKRLIKFAVPGTTLTAVIITAFISTAHAQKHIQSGHVQIVINNEQGPPCQMSAIVYLDHKRRPYVIQSDKTIDTFELDYNTTYNITAQVYAEDPDYEHIFPFRREKRLTYYKDIEINQPKSRIEIIVEYDEGTKLGNDFKDAPKGKIYWGELTNLFDNDLDTFIDDVEDFFGTNIAKVESNPNTLPNFVVIIKNGKRIFISNSNYLPRFPGSNCFEHDERAIDEKIKQTYDEIRNTEEKIQGEEAKQSDKNGIVSTRMGEKSFSYDKERMIKSIVEYKNKLSKQVEDLQEEKRNIFTAFLTDYDMYEFEQNGNSLKILFKKSDDETWKDITDQPNFYKERSMSKM